MKTNRKNYLLFVVVIITLICFTGCSSSNNSDTSNNRDELEPTEMPTTEGTEEPLSSDVNNYIEPVGVPTSEEVISSATKALDNQDIDGFLLHVVPSEQRAMKDKLNKLIQLGQPGQIAIQRISDSWENAIIVEQTNDYIKLEHEISLPSGTIKTTYFEMIFIDGVWKIL